LRLASPQFLGLDIESSLFLLPLQRFYLGWKEKL